MKPDELRQRIGHLFWVWADGPGDDHDDGYSWEGTLVAVDDEGYGHLRLSNGVIEKLRSDDENLYWHDETELPR